jgi:hypothetical protein
MLSLYVEPDDVEVNHQTLHSLEINRVHVALLKSGTLINWTPAHSIRALCRFDKSTYAKVYDAIATLLIAKEEVYEIALEYERSLKPAAKYIEILAKLTNPDPVDAVVYLCPNHRILRSIREVFRSPLKKPVLVADHEHFVGDPVNAMLEWCYRETTMHSALVQIRQRSGTGTNGR